MTITPKSALLNSDSRKRINQQIDNYLKQNVSNSLSEIHIQQKASNNQQTEDKITNIDRSDKFDHQDCFDDRVTS